MFAKKSLGQNFLQSESAIKKIVEAGEVSSEDFVLEIGPGKGALTKNLLKTGAKVLAIEKDREMITFLEEMFPTEVESGQLTLENGDILKYEPEMSEYKLIANIPYYITGEIIEKFLSIGKQPSRMVLLVQKEVAERIVSRDGKESILSNAVKAYSTPKFIQKVKAGSFVPAPKVDSAILLLENVSKDFFINNDITEEKFFKIMKAGFAHKRKRLFSNLKELMINSSEESLMTITGLDKNIRAEKLTTDDWKTITQAL